MVSIMEAGLHRRQAGSPLQFKTSSRPSVAPAPQHRNVTVKTAQQETSLTVEASQQPIRVSQFVRPEKRTYAKESITATGTLKPPAEWYPAWMKYRRREDNYVFWQDKFSRNSLDIAPDEKRWTLFSTLWFLVMQTRYYAAPPALRYIVYLGWRTAMNALYEGHKKLVLLQCKLDAYLAARALGLASLLQPTMTPTQSGEAATADDATTIDSAVSIASTSSTQGVGGEGSEGTTSDAIRQQLPGFSLTMALRRLHWKNTLLAELLYVFNVYKTGRVHMLPPKKRPPQRPTLFFVF